MSVILLWVGFAGMNLQNCIFMGNTRECDPNSGNPKFMVTNCVFSGRLPSGDYDWLTSLNVFDSVTASFAYSYFFSEQCLTPACSAAPTSTNSSQFPESQQFTHSLSLANSFLREASSGLRAIETNEFTFSSHAYVRVGFILRGGLFSLLIF
jgi:hypothetical protein